MPWKKILNLKNEKTCSKADESPYPPDTPPTGKQLSPKQTVNLKKTAQTAQKSALFSFVYIG
jgi:hypothetical protein